MVTSADTSADLCHDVLDLRVVLERVRRQVLAVAGLLVAAVRHLARERNQHGHALTGGRVEPLGKCLLRGLDRAVDVSLGAAWHLGDLPARRGVDHVHGPAVHGADPLSAYEVLVTGRGLRSHTASLLRKGLPVEPYTPLAPAARLRSTPVSRINRCARITGI